jgi:hypothetical protein
MSNKYMKESLSVSPFLFIVKFILIPWIHSKFTYNYIEALESNINDNIK